MSAVIRRQGTGKFFMSKVQYWPDASSPTWTSIPGEEFVFESATVASVFAERHQILEAVIESWDMGKAEGVKNDQEKPRWSLMPWSSLKTILKVIDFGAKKYTPDNWKKVDAQRYREALYRHVIDYANGERVDAESKLPTLAHVGANVLFLIFHDEEEGTK